MLTIKMRYAYEESYIPPRCKNPRTRDVVGECLVNIPSANSCDAPIAMRHKSYCAISTINYRWFNNHLYKRVPRREHYSCADGWWTITELKKYLARDYVPRYLYGENEQDCIEKCKETASNYLILNGNQVWEKCGEPRYVIVTFGLGHNHASTALMIDNHYNDNIRGDFYFNALDRDNAIKHCLQVAKNRGDTNSFSDIKKSSKITVYIPEAVRCNPAQEAGPGDDFLNTVEELTEIAGDSFEAGLLVICASMKGGL